MTCKYKVKIKDIQYNYKVQMTDIQSKYKFKVFCTGYDDSEIKEKIDAMYQAWPKVSGEGETITLNDTANTTMAIDLKGNTSQETTTGKNLFKETGGVANGTYNNGLYTSNSLRSYQVMNMNGENITYIANTKYYISMDLRRTTGTGTINAINVGTTTGVVDHFPTISNEFQKYYIEFTPTSDYTSNKITVQSGNASVVFEAKNLMVSTSSDTNYEPYTGGIPSPNPDYPQTISNVTGTNTIKINGKNLFDKNTNQLENRSATRVGTTGYISLKAGTYTLSYTGADSSYYIYHDSNNTKIGESNWVNGTSTFTLNNDYKLVIIFGKTNNANIDASEVQNIQIEKGSTPTEYEAYKEQSYTINLEDIELCKIGDYQDKIYKDNGKWYLNKQIGKATNSSFEQIMAVSSSIGSNLYAYACSNSLGINSYSNVGAVISNLFVPKHLGSTSATTDSTNVRFNMGIAKHSSTSQLVISIEKSYLTTGSTSEFNTFLTNNNFYFYYIKATPTYEEITDTTLISQLEALKEAESYLGQTNISQVNNDAPFIINASALYDLNNLITRVAILETE